MIYTPLKRFDDQTKVSQSQSDDDNLDIISLDNNKGFSDLDLLSLYIFCAFEHKE